MLVERAQIGRLGVLRRRGVPGLVYGLYFYLLGFRQSQRQRVAVRQQFDGVAHGGFLLYFHVGACYQPHVEEVLPQFAVSSHGGYLGPLAYR